MKILTTTALALGLAATGVHAENHSSENGDSMQSEGAMTATDNQMANADSADLIRSRDITGGNVYTTAGLDDWVEGSMYDAVSGDWTNIGEIEDLVLNKSGQMIGIVAEIGGFLDVGDKTVMIPVEEVNLVAVDDATYGYVTNRSEEELEELEGVDEGFWN
ncbi:PRC-barrel domain-containing protein [Palleronia salina]|uniref:PRC-barrel domain-containing protein n=1 Tax=Palleronia salina TaxID=313368 RepID=A0A1M6AID1_9RHOB|nr:PRC-barrel domain-containing protein [Palleronia salina]SHI36078.1 PRC-barrel domain-containing protein [Palleronia salina]